MLLKSKSAKLMKVRQQSGADAQKLAAQYDVLAGNTNFFGDSTESVSERHLPKSYLLPISGSPQA